MEEMNAGPQYASRDIVALDRDGGHYCRHLVAMTREDLFTKSDIAAELAWRDHRIARLRHALLLAERLCNEALPKLNWGASVLDANAITLLNQTPVAIHNALLMDDHGLRSVAERAG